MAYCRQVTDVRHFFGVVCVALALVVVFTADVQAEGVPEQKITISPAMISLSAKPGGSVEGRVTIANQGSEAFMVALRAVPYSVRDGDYQADFRQAPGTESPHEWVIVTKETFALSPTRVRDVSYSIRIPEATEPGGYYAVLFAESSPEGISAKEMTTHNRAGQVLLITVEGPVVKGGAAVGSAVAPVSFSGSVDVSSDVSNTGGVHFGAKSSVTVHDIFGRLIWDAELEKYVLPQTTRRFAMTWQGGLPFGIYKVTRHAEYLGKTENLPDYWLVVVHPFIIAGVSILFGALIVRYVSSRRRIASAHK